MDDILSSERVWFATVILGFEYCYYYRVIWSSVARRNRILGLDASNHSMFLRGTGVSFGLCFLGNSNWVLG